MTAVDVVVLSSSPDSPRSPTRARQNLRTACHVLPRDATPPPVPSPSELLQPQTRSRFFPTPTASNQCSVDAPKPKTRSTKKAPTVKADNQSAPGKTGRKTKKVADEPAPVVPGSPPLDPVGQMDTAPKSARGRPRKTARSKEQSNMKLAGKVTKTSTEQQAKKPTKASKETTSAEQPFLTDQKEMPAPTNALGKDEQLHLDEAMRRRMDWTPPKESACESVTLTDNSGKQKKDCESNTMGEFGKLLSDYSFSGSAPTLPDLPQNANNGPTKRRRIELEHPQIQQLANGKPYSLSDYESTDDAVWGKSKKATKANPKKFTTLTARMTAQYAQNDTQEEEELAMDCIPDIRATKSRRGKARQTDKDSSFTILSPEAAVEFMNDQDLVFGTCSQLEREDSPQTLREMQQAIRVSESLSYREGTCDSVHAHKTKAAEERPMRSVSRITGTKNLWNVGSRDIKGSLVQSKELNVVDLTDRPELPAKSNEKLVKPTPTPLDKNWFEFDFADIDSPPEKKPPKRSSSSNVQSQPTAIAKSIKETEIPVEPVPSQPADPQAPQMPQYAGFPDAELSKQIATFGFKSVRGRKKMIDLLQQCWESKHGGAATGSQPAAQVEQSKTLALIQSNGPKLISDSKSKAKAKPKSTTKEPSLVTAKSASASRINSQKGPPKGPKSKSTTEPSSSFIDLEEIQDSEEEITPSPSQVQKHYASIYSYRIGQSHEHTLDILTKPPPTSPIKRKGPSKVSVTRTRTADPTSRVNPVDVSAQITKAVRAQPRLSPLSSALGSRSRPTWHEKILMYDPIILEDFTAWLNVEGLGLVGEDREVGTASVREWCESKGVCCCWKKNASW
ncbi:hypothetical protein N7508_009265 [Penicillium antarcticum]|uniref:uncharacterized protein n=1 Tax=Penicillium antarcticum TaxID=416450 RepID=UPI002397131F|nr:uncharacterized protein N7508_009265 [Penicillium antarcticum]KAJ5294444.1 hypothetical protein N7508_009265 [Penicillium antarcticum]